MSHYLKMFRVPNKRILHQALNFSKKKIDQALQLQA